MKKTSISSNITAFPFNNVFVLAENAFENFVHGARTGDTFATILATYCTYEW